MATYREYAKERGLSNLQIEEITSGLFDIDQELQYDPNDDRTGAIPYGGMVYRVDTDRYLYINTNACDTVEDIDFETGDVIKEWRLEIDLHTQIMHANNLYELCEILNNENNQKELEQYDITSLPSYGGITPIDTTAVYSWDKDSLLVPDDFIDNGIENNWKIVLRCNCSEATFHCQCEILKEEVRKISKKDFLAAYEETTQADFTNANGSRTDMMGSGTYKGLKVNVYYDIPENDSDSCIQAYFDSIDWDSAMYKVELPDSFDLSYI